MDADPFLAEFVVPEAHVTFRPEDRLGQGCFGAVYKGNLRERTPVCVKATLENCELYGLVPGSTEFARVCEEVMGEARTLARLRSDHVVPFRGIVMSGEVTSATAAPAVYPRYILTDLADCSLEVYLKRLGRPLCVAEYIDMFAQITSGLCTLHEQHPHPLIHRDLKPDSVLVFPVHGGSGVTYKLGDLGLAKAASTRIKLSQRYGGGVQQLYQAPEVLSGEFDAKVDVFSLGVMMSQVAMLYLEPLPATPAVVFIDVGERFSVVERAVAKLRRECAGGVPELADLLGNCCAKLPEHRPTSSAVWEALRGIKDRCGGGDVIREPPAAATARAADTAAAAVVRCSEAEALAAVVGVRAYVSEEGFDPAEVVPVSEFVEMYDAVAGWMTSSEKVAKAACDALFAVCVNNPVNIRAIVCDNGGLTRVIFPGMDAHVGSYDVQMFSSVALAIMLRDSDDQSEAPAAMCVIDGLYERVKEAILSVSGSLEKIARAKENHGRLSSPDEVLAHFN